MKRPVLYAITVALGFSAFAPSAFADDPYHYCHWYASSAVHESNRAREVGSCRHLVWESPGRWTVNFEQHYQWCRSMYGSGQNAAEQDARIEDLRECGGL